MRKIPILVLILATNTWAAGTLHVMQSFGTGNLREGSDLYAGLILDSQGNLYGVAESGGTRGAGVVYELSPSTGGAWTETVLYNFKGGAEDGASPHATLMADSAGNLYGTTVSGGQASTTCRTGCGTVYMLTPAPVTGRKACSIASPAAATARFPTRASPWIPPGTYMARPYPAAHPTRARYTS
jgi:uncharacterized repeat protein (TIGR03803 family)